MDYLRSATFGGLFGVTFTVAATFQVAMALVGLICAFGAPAMFNTNGVAAQSTVQALSALFALLVAMVLVNAMISAVGAALWLGVRRFLPKRSVATGG